MENLDTKLLKEASKELYNQINEEVSKLGYNLTYGYSFSKDSPEIIMRSQYASIKRYLYIFGSKKTKEKIVKLIPPEFTYENVTIPVKLKFICPEQI